MGKNKEKTENYNHRKTCVLQRFLSIRRCRNIFPPGAHENGSPAPPVASLLSPPVAGVDGRCGLFSRDEKSKFVLYRQRVHFSPRPPFALPPRW